MTKLYISYTETREGGEPYDPDDRWTNHSPVYITATITGVSTTQPKHHYWETLDTEEEFNVGDDVYLLTVRYGDGDTFGSSNGHLHIDAAYHDAQQAKDDRDALEKDYTDHPNYEWQRDNPNQRRWSAGVWKGYFSSLDYTDVEHFKVL